MPASWIAPDHILDLRVRVRLRHSLVAQRGESQQRIQAVLYHHGFPQRRNLMTAQGRQSLATQGAAGDAREPILIAVAMVDVLDGQLAPIDNQLRSYARRQPGCRALMGQFGVGEMRRSRSSPSSVTRAAAPPRATPSAMPGWTSPCISLSAVARPATSAAKARRRCDGRCSGPRCAPRAPGARTASTTARLPNRPGGTSAGPAVARKLLKRSYHTLRELGEEALAPA